MRIEPRRVALAALVSLLVSVIASAASIESFAPTGETKGVRQVSVRFSEAMVAFGEPRQFDPFAIKCTPSEFSGVGRWIDARIWTFEFEQPLPAGVACEFALNADTKTLAGNAIPPAEFSFNTGGPAVIWSDPYERARAIDERQMFVLGLDAPATAESIAAHAHCEAAGVGEQIPLKLVTGKEREAVLAARKIQVQRLLLIAKRERQIILLKDKKSLDEFAAVVVVQCQRALPPQAQVKLVWGAGIASNSGLATSKAQRLAFQTRPTFTARFTCTRVNPDAACLPILPFQLDFTAPVSVEQLRKIQLRGPGGNVFPAKIAKEAERTDARVTFAAPFPESAQLALELPADLHDDSGRKLANQKRFPLTVKTDEYPPLVKFPTRFGILERSDPVLPVTLRNVERELGGKLLLAGDATVSGKVLRVGDPSNTAAAPELIRWINKLKEFESQRYKPAGKGKPETEILPGAESIFAANTPTKAFTLPKAEGEKTMEVIGIPLSGPGFYVVELASPRLGLALLDDKKPYYAQTGVLVTNLAVHFKHGRESSLAWVTSLDRGEPVSDVTIVVRDCLGKEHWRGNTDKAGIAPIAKALPAQSTLPRCAQMGQGLFVSASKTDDFSFVWTAWNEGIQPWRFNLPTAAWDGPIVAHAIFDRTLLRAGETVSMKLMLRQQTSAGFALMDRDRMSSKVVIRHTGSGDKYELKVAWDERGSTEAVWKIPNEAKLGTYEVILHGTGAKDSERIAGTFRVEAFRVPTLKATLNAPTAPLVRPKEVSFDLQLAYLSGGAAGNTPVKARAMITPFVVSLAEYDAFVFSNGPVKLGRGETDQYGEAEEESTEDEDTPARAVGKDTKLLPTQNLKLDAQGTAAIRYDKLPAVVTPQQLLAEVEYRDANGETLTAAKTVTLWPAKLNLGVKTDDWAGSKEELNLLVAAVDLSGKPLANVPVEVELFERKFYSHRKRLIGGFYAYESYSEVKSVGRGDAAHPQTCSGQSDSLGYLHCKLKPAQSGELLVQAVAHDADGQLVSANREVWVAGDEDWWFKEENNDRFDLLPEKKHYEPGGKARFQVRVPFREATVLVTVEREGVLDSFVTKLSGKSPVIEVPMKANYAPNVFVSALVLRGRVAQPAATALVDLGKPAFRLGIAKIDVGWAKNRLAVKVAAERPEYRVREQAAVTIQVRAPDGKLPPKDTEVTLAAVDEGLLQLKPNDSWKLLDAMMRGRGIEVETATAIQEVVGKRHFGKKALPPGGGGGRSTTRELFDTLLYWQARVKLDAKGEARVAIPLNDSLSSFRIVGVAEGGSSLFGTGETSIRTNQELQLLSGLPPLVREGDRFSGQFTLRNTTAVKQQVELTGALRPDVGSVMTLAAQHLELAPQATQTVKWEVSVPLDATRLAWEVDVKGAGASDRLRVTQQVASAVAVRTLQATLLQLTGKQTMPVAIPNEAIPGRGGIAVSVQPKLGSDLPGVHEWISRYPYTCLEQRASSAVALRDRKRWDAVMNSLPAQLDRDGFAKYFPLMRDGSEVLTAYLLQLSAAADWPLPTEATDHMVGALRGFVEGRIARHGDMPTADLTFRKLQAMAALAAVKQFDPKWTQTLIIEPNLWPTSAVLDWIAILQAQPKLAKRDAWLVEAKNVLRARTQLSGMTVTLSTDKQDYLWWLMVSGDSNINRLLLQLMTEADWREDAGRLARGAIGRQQQGHWNTTVANAWGVLALDKFARTFESAPVSGVVDASLAGQSKSLDWKTNAEGGELQFAWPRGTGELSLAQIGTGAPWAIVSSRAAVPFAKPFSAGLKIARKIEPVEQKVKGEWHRGDVARITLDLESASQLTWVVVDDPLPAGTQVFGSGLGGDSSMLAGGNRTTGSWALWPAFEERRFDAFRVYYRYVPTGKWTVTYNLRFNQDGTFQLPESRVEALYAPEIFGVSPNAAIGVKP